jgi:hypothetical protein
MSSDEALRRAIKLALDEGEHECAAAHRLRRGGSGL